MDANQILHRVSLRGLAKCKACNHFNGIRANACKNKSCKLSRIEVKRKPKPKIHAVQLITIDDSTKLFSVQTSTSADNRNFVSVTDKIISSDANGSIISRNAICYVDTCKYDSNDVNISCKHVKNSLEHCSSKAKVAKIDLVTLSAFQLDGNEQQRLWKLYKDGEQTVPIVQRISRTVFVVRCDISVSFPAGLLHVICNEDPNGARYSCACKKIKILMSSNQVILEKDICEHLILVFVAILSDPELKDDFKYLSASKFMPQGNHTIEELRKLLCVDIISLNKQPNDMLSPGEDSIESIQASYDNLTNGTVAIDSLDNIELIQIPNIPKIKITDDHFVDDDDFQSIDVENMPIVDQLHGHLEFSNQDTVNDTTGLELIKIVDQFEVEDQIEFTDVQQTDQFHQIDNGIYEMNDINYWNCDNNEFSTLCHNDTLIDNNLIQPINSFRMTTKTTSLSSQHSSNVITEINCDVDEEYDQICNGLNDVELKMYSNWLNSIIERINLTMDYNDNGSPDPIISHIPHLYFDILRTKFSTGSKKKRLPNHTLIIPDGKYKGFTLYCWIFSNVKLVKHIFSTSTMQLETVQSFTKTPMNTFKRIEEDEVISMIEVKSTMGSNQLKRIRPTIYRTFLKLKSSDGIQKGKSSIPGLFTVEWIPNILPKSQYGELRIKIEFGHMKNDTVIEKE